MIFVRATKLKPKFYLNSLKAMGPSHVESKWNVPIMCYKKKYNVWCLFKLLFERNKKNSILDMEFHEIKDLVHSPNLYKKIDKHTNIDNETCIRNIN